MKLIVANPDYAHSKLRDGCEIIISMCHLAQKRNAAIHGYDVEYIDKNHQPSESNIHL